MTSFLHRRELTFAFLCWSGYVVLWTVTVGSAVGIAILCWLVGMIVFGSLRVATRPLVERRRAGAEAAEQLLYRPADR